jgi:hypothetical protein
MSTPDSVRPKATPGEIRDYFDPPKPTLQELKNLKKDSTGRDLPDYDQIAYGLGDGSLTY